MLFFGLFAVVTVLLGMQVFNTKAPSIPTRSADNTPTQSVDTSDVPLQTVLAENFDTPWGIAILPDQTMLVTERSGRVTRLPLNGQSDPVEAAIISGVKELGEGGLLGITVHPQYETNKFVYLYYTYSSIGNDTLNRVIRMTDTGTALTDETLIVDRIPGAANHNGGRIKFGPDGLLYIGTGDAQNPTQAQVTTTLGGKILRVTDEGKAAPGNPFGNQVYSYGHRNVQGLAFDASGALWATEHGRSGVASGLDEVNRIESGKNYGWPDSEGDTVKSGTVGPAAQSTASVTWAPSGAAFVGNSMFFSGLRGQSLYEAVIQNGSVVQVKEHFKGELGRIREVVAQDGLLYITTSNRDGRGIPRTGDDKVIRVNPEKL